MRPLGRLSGRLVPGAAIALLLLTTGCAPQAVTRQGKDIADMYDVVLALAVMIWLGVVGAMLWAVVRYRRRPGDTELPPQIHGNTTFEVVWTAIPTVIVLLLFGMSYTTLRTIDRRAPVGELGAIIEARAVQWNWEFDYGNGVLVRTPPGGDAPPRMVVPVGERIRIELRSDNVLHAWYVPEFLFKRDVVPGQGNAFEFTVDVPGTYKGQCAELCGTGHAVMNFELQAVGRSVFEDWLAETKRAAATRACDEQPNPTPRIASLPGSTVFQFDKPCLSVPAGQPVKLTFVHQGGAQHNVAVWTKAGGKKLAETPVVTGGTHTLDVPALEPGNYFYNCIVHPVAMSGVYTAK